MFKIERKNSYCELSLFTINGITASMYDFGEKNTTPLPEKLQKDGTRGCGTLIFKPYECTKEVLDKYGIDEKEYNEICEEIENLIEDDNCTECN